MFSSDQITLIAESKTAGSEGYPEIVETSTPIYADVKSVSRTEFYESLKAGVKLVIVFEIWDNEYSNQKLVEYGGKRYRVERTYQSPLSERLQLNCSEAVR